jgi:hypothetical protein
MAHQEVLERDQYRPRNADHGRRDQAITGKRVVGRCEGERCSNSTQEENVPCLYLGILIGKRPPTQ